MKGASNLPEEELKEPAVDIDIYQKLDTKLIKMMQSEPKISSKAPPDCLNTWRRLGRLDLN